MHARLVTLSSGGPLPLFHIPKRTPCHKQISGGSGGGARGACPPLCWDQTAAPRAEKILLGDGPSHLSKDLDNRAPPPYLKVWFQHYKCYYFLCLGLRLTCKKLKNNCISLNLFHFKAVQIHCSVFGVRSDIKATKE